jgi:hypothetical protein
VYPDRFKLVLVVGESSDNTPVQGWDNADARDDGSTSVIRESGWVDADKIERHCFPPAADTAVFVCGVPGMYDEEKRGERNHMREERREEQHGLCGVLCFVCDGVRW